MKPTPTYRRNKNNAVCMADYMVVTSNIPFEPWLVNCKIEPEKKRNNYNNLKSKAGYYRNAEGRMIASLIPNAEQAKSYENAIFISGCKVDRFRCYLYGLLLQIHGTSIHEPWNEEMIEQIKKITWMLS